MSDFSLCARFPGVLLFYLSTIFMLYCLCGWWRMILHLIGGILYLDSCWHVEVKTWLGQYGQENPFGFISSTWPRQVWCPGHLMEEQAP